jgi:hypothetical protein
VSESELQHAIFVALGALPGVVAWRNNVGVAAQGERSVAYGVGGKGAPDLLVEVQRGAWWVAVWLEVKIETGRVRPEQRAWHDAARRAGRHVFVVRSVQDALDIVSSMQRSE